MSLGIPILDSALDAQLRDMFSFGSWLGCTLIMLIPIPLFYLIILTFRKRAQKERRNALAEEIGKVKGLHTVFNSHNTLDVRGKRRGVDVDIRHTTDVWSSPKRMEFNFRFKRPVDESLAEALRDEMDADVAVDGQKVLVRMDRWPASIIKETDRVIDMVRKV